MNGLINKLIKIYLSGKIIRTLMSSPPSNPIYLHTQCIMYANAITQTLGFHARKDKQGCNQDVVIDADKASQGRTCQEVGEGRR